MTGDVQDVLPPEQDSAAHSANATEDGPGSDRNAANARIGKKSMRVKREHWERIKIALPDHLWLLLQMEAVQEVIKHLDQEAVSICARLYPLG